MDGGLVWLLGWCLAGCVVLAALLAVLIRLTPTDRRPDTWVEWSPGHDTVAEGPVSDPASVEHP